PGHWPCVVPFCGGNIRNGCLGRARIKQEKRMVRTSAGWNRARRMSGAAGVVCGLFLAAVAMGSDSGGAVQPVFAGKLPNVPGKSLTAVVVRYAPGGKSQAHRHAGSVFAYGLSGRIRSENSATGPARVYSTGESFFEPSGS